MRDFQKWKLGTLTPSQVHQEVAGALAVFYPQTTFAETFGLVFAEANALGTPVLAHPLGSAEEVLSAGGAGQVMDLTEDEVVVDQIALWRDGGRPEVRGAAQFRLETVTKTWLDLLKEEKIG